MAAGCTRCGAPMQAVVDGTDGTTWTDNCTRCGVTLPREGPPSTLKTGITVETVPQTGEKLVYTRDHGQAFDRIARMEGAIVADISEDGRTAILETPEGPVAVEVGGRDPDWGVRHVSNAEAQELLDRKPLEGGSFGKWRRVEDVEQPYTREEQARIKEHLIQTGQDPAPPHWEPKRCASCGSEDIYLESPAEGWSCRNCGRSDSDET